MTSHVQLWDQLDVIIKSLESVRYLHLHFPQANVNVPGFADDNTRDLSDHTCHKLWHLLSDHEGLPHCRFKQSKERLRKAGAMHLKRLTISYGRTVDDDFLPVVFSLENFQRRTCIIEPGDSTASCITLRCLEQEVAQKLLQEDEEKRFFYEQELEHLGHLAEGIAPPIPGGVFPGTWPLFCLKKEQLKAGQKRMDSWKPVGDVAAEDLETDEVLTRLPL